MRQLDVAGRRRLGRTTLLSNRLDWTAEQVVEGYSGQQHIERVFRGLKDGDWLGWDPMHHWTDSKIHVHAFYCMLGISLLQYLHKNVDAVWPGLSMEQLIEQLKQILHAFYCMLGISLLQHVHKNVEAVWPGLSLEQLIEQLKQIQQFALLYPPQGDKGPNRVATVLSEQTLAQQSLAEALGLNTLRSTPSR